jgi:cell division septation protein DedD
VSHHVQDDGFHEIQLNGKQLVFLFMAATVVSVVIFLCGVLVGRGVRAERINADAAAGAAEPAPEPAPPPAAGQPSADADPTKAAAPPATEDLSYFDRLEKAKAPSEPLKTASTSGPAPAPAPEAAKKPDMPAPKATAKAEPPPQPKAAEKPEPVRPAAAEPAEPSGQGFAVQIAALNVRSEADAIARRLSSKGYAAYVMSPANGTPAVYRVRVGKFPTRREAESVAARLQREEQFKPWVTR